MRSLFRLLPVLFVTATLGCKHVGEVTPIDAEQLTREQMLEAHFTSVYEAIASLRSAWLTVRGTDSFGKTSEVMVYFDSTRLGGVSELGAITVNQVASVRHYNGVDATMRFGVGHSAGVIQLTAYRQPSSSR